MCLSTRGECLTRNIPPWDQVHPLGPGTTPQARYTPWDQVHPPGPGAPPDQIHPLGPGTPLPPGARYTPRDQVGTPQDQVPPLGPGVPPDQVHPPGQGTPPGTQVSPQTRYTHPGPGTLPRPGTTPLDTATAADGTHPTGMHSYYDNVVVTHTTSVKTLPDIVITSTLYIVSIIYRNKQTVQEMWYNSVLGINSRNVLQFCPHKQSRKCSILSLKSIPETCCNFVLTMN